jgi:hypothetical protein
MAALTTSFMAVRTSTFTGSKVAARVAPAPVARRSVVVRAAEEAAAPAKTVEAPWTVPTLDPNTPSPIFGGSTGGLLRKAQVEEFYVLTWEAKKESIFEMPVRVCPRAIRPSLIPSLSPAAVERACAGGYGRWQGFVRPRSIDRGGSAAAACSHAACSGAVSRR